ncbi:MAG: hypothetical protein ACI9XO_000954 [Paraglaciecola sp.]|jgi:hypothetical protein
MGIYQMLYFGKIETDNLKDYYEATIEKDSWKITLDKIKEFIENISLINGWNKRLYFENHQNEG